MGKADYDTAGPVSKGQGSGRQVAQTSKEAILSPAPLSLSLPPPLAILALYFWVFSLLPLFTQFWKVGHISAGGSYMKRAGGGTVSRNLPA